MIYQYAVLISGSGQTVPMAHRFQEYKFKLGGDQI